MMRPMTRAVVATLVTVCSLSVHESRAQSVERQAFRLFAKRAYGLLQVIDTATTVADFLSARREKQLSTKYYALLESAVWLEHNKDFAAARRAYYEILKQARSESTGKSVFNSGENVVDLVKQAESVLPQKQSFGQNLERVVDAGRTVGTDRNTGALTSTYTVITDAAGNLVTMFPGRPSR